MGNTPPQQTNTPQEPQMGTQNTYQKTYTPQQMGTLYHVDRLKVVGGETVYILRDGVYVECIVVDFPAYYGTTAKYEVLPIGSTKSEKVKQDEVYTDNPDLHSKQKFDPQPVQDDNTEAVQAADTEPVLPKAVADKSVDPTTLYEVDPEKKDGDVEKNYTDNIDLSKNVTVSKVNIHYYKYDPKQYEINKDVYFINNENNMVKGKLKALPSKPFGFFVTGKYKVEVDIGGRITDVDHVYTNDFFKAKVKDPNVFVNVKNGYVGGRRRKSKKVFKNKNKKRSKNSRSRRH